jgi:hypothetical protein
MNLLDLLKAAKREMGVSGPVPTTAQSLTGEMLRVRNWIIDSNREICAEKSNWKFLRSRFTVDTVIGTEAYLPEDCTDTKLSAVMTEDGFSRWITEKYDTFRIYLTSAGASTQQRFWPRDYESFRFLYQLQPPANGQPVYYAIRDDDLAILLAPKPNAVYTVTGEYYRRAPDLDADADIPLFPERFHMAIVWRAVRKYAQYEEDGGVYAAANIDYKRIHGPLLKDQLPRLRLGGPLA